MPGRYGPWRRDYGFVHLAGGGAWEHIEAELVSMADTSGKLDWWVFVDSTVCRVHVPAASVRRESFFIVDDEPDDHALGVSWGGRPIKVQAAVDRARDVSGAADGRSEDGLPDDGPGARSDPYGPRRTGVTPPASAAGAGRQSLLLTGPGCLGAAACEGCNVVEYCFNHLKHHQGFAARYDKIAVRYRITTYIASINHWLKRLT